MKSILFCFAMMCAVVTVFANDYNKEMRESITALMKVDENTTQYLNIAHKFERLSEQNKKDWLPPYYAALSNVWATFSNEDKSEADSILAHCTSLLDRAESLGGEKSELLCLRSMVASATIMVSPMTRGMKYGLQATDFIEKAKKANPNNPRVYFVKAQSLIFTPVMFGGGCENAIPIAQEATEKYKTFKPKSELDPNWGRTECVELLNECK